MKHLPVNVSMVSFCSRWPATVSQTKKRSILGRAASLTIKVTMLEPGKGQQHRANRP
jgi:hypothetical protein